MVRKEDTRPEKIDVQSFDSYAMDTYTGRPIQSHLLLLKWEFQLSPLLWTLHMRL
jgi:hypothetical protein